MQLIHRYLFLYKTSNSKDARMFFFQNDKVYPIQDEVPDGIKNVQNGGGGGASCVQITQSGNIKKRTKI